MGKLEDQSITVQSHVLVEHKRSINFGEPNFGGKIRETEKLIKYLGKEKLRIEQKLQGLAFEIRKTTYELECLYRRENETSYDMADIRRKLDIFQLFQEKLSSKPPRPCSLSSEDVHKQKLHFRVLHGTSSLAEENKHLKRAETGKLKEELDDPSDWLLRRMRCHRKRPEDRIPEIKYNGFGRYYYHEEESVAEAIVRGKIWNSLSSNRRDIRDHIKALTEEFEELRKEHARARQSIGGNEREMKALDKQKCDLTKKLNSINPRKKEAHRLVSKLTKQRVRVTLNS